MQQPLPTIGQAISCWRVRERLACGGGGTGFLSKVDLTHGRGFAALGALPVPPPQEFLWFFLGLIILIAVLSYFMELSASGEPPTPDRCWRGGIFYVNRDDPALFVRKRFRSRGYTLNFGNPWSWAVLVLIGLMAVAPVVLAALSVRTLIHRVPLPRR